MQLSVIIPTYNEKNVLPECLESLGNQTYTDFEIIVIDDRSNDTTEDVVRNLKSQISNLKFLVQSHKGAGVARNLGADSANGDILVFVDADMTFDKDFLINLVKPIENGDAKGTFSKEEYVSNWDNVWARCWNINEGWEAKHRHRPNYPDYQPVFRAVLKSEFVKVNGYTPGGYDDDWSLYGKLGYEATNAPGAIFYHKNPSGLAEVFRQAKWAGKRKYKFGLFGYLGGLVRASFPTSLIIGIFKSLKNKLLLFTLFKIVYDFGVFVGILDYLISGKSSK
jgi:glycosyltransferase involved in cell wall biosynthesis